MRPSFEDYHQQTPNVWLQFEKFTIQTIHRGFNHYSAKGIFELIRWHTGVTTGGGLTDLKSIIIIRPILPVCLNCVIRNIKAFFLNGN